MGRPDGFVDECRGDQRPGPILNGRQLHVLGQGVQPQPDGFLPAAAALNHSFHLVHLPAELGNLQDQILPGDDDDLPDGLAVLKGPYRSYDHGFSPQGGHDLVYAPHPGGRARRHDHRAAAFQGQHLPGRPGRLRKLHAYSSFISFL